MLKAYLISVVIWMMINYSMIIMFGERVKSNGWVDEHSVPIGKFKILFVMSAVPLVRLLILSCFIYMILNTQAQYDDMEE